DRCARAAGLRRRHQRREARGRAFGRQSLTPRGTCAARHSMRGSPFIAADGVSVTFRSANRAPVVALADFDLRVARGQFVSLVGPSGCGKSTFLNVVLGLRRPDAGEVRIDGRRVDGPAPDRAMVFQEFGLLPWRTAGANVELGLELRGMASQGRRRRATGLIHLGGLTRFERPYPPQLSGRREQRVGLSLATTPDIWLRDEPFAALDAQTRDLMQAELLQVWERTRKTVLFVTHSIEEAAYLSDRVNVVSARPGRPKAEIEVRLPRPRDYEMRLSPEFNELKLGIWKALKEELKAGV